MKYIVVITSSLLAFSFTTLAQTKSKPKKATPVKKQVVVQTVTPAVQLKTIEDSASYAIGQNIAQSISKDLKALNKEAFLDAIKTVFKGQTPQLSEEQTRSVLAKFSQQEQLNEAKPEIDKGLAFLEKNKSRNGVHVTPSGLQYEVLKQGTGAKPTVNDSVVCNYKGMLLDSMEFDNSYNRGEPLTISLNNVITGWKEGLQLMNTGSMYRFYIPYKLGYGLKGAGGDIPPGATLIFDIELLDVKKAP